MPRANVRIRLDVRAVALALAPRRTGAVELSSHARAILEHADPGPPGSATRLVICTMPEARALLDHFSGLVDLLAGTAEPADAVICANARDTIRRALVSAGQ